LYHPAYFLGPCMRKIRADSTTRYSEALLLNSIANAIHPEGRQYSRQVRGFHSFYKDRVFDAYSKSQTTTNTVVILPARTAITKTLCTDGVFNYVIPQVATSCDWE